MSDVPHDRSPGRGKRITGIVLGVLTAFLLIGAVQDPDLAGMLIVGFLGLGGWLLHRSGARDAERARKSALEQLQLPVLDLANEDGRLTATEVATRLGWTLELAKEVLDSLEDGMRVCSMPSDEGVMVYEFRELLHDPDRPRVQSSTEPPPLPVEMQVLGEPSPLPAAQPARGPST